ncbi:MAG: hypothetical protein LBH29_04105 [Elusimicrobiota bacterium]|jgi:uncharacterized membrane protein YcgQ (UPF0703/DUF1980 family)|nr:hypothetical protein [Elusimicrobiota bacterium]
MRKFCFAVVLLFALFAAQTDIYSAGELEIRDRFFITQINNIYKNPKSYLGTVIKYEGIFDSFASYNGKEKIYCVFRYGPGCCGPDAYAGFEIISDKSYPKPNDWVEVSGILEEYEIAPELKNLRIRVRSLKVLEQRGKEVVLR